MNARKNIVPKSECEKLYWSGLSIDRLTQKYYNARGENKITRKDVRNAVKLIVLESVKKEFKSTSAE